MLRRSMGGFFGINRTVRRNGCAEARVENGAGRKDALTD